MRELPERCLPFEPDLSALLDGELDAVREAELRAHVGGCPHCGARLAALRGVDAALQSLEAPAVRPELAARMAARLAADRSAARAQGAANAMRRPARRSRWMRVASLVPAAAVLALGLLVIPRLFERVDSTPPVLSPALSPLPAASAIARREPEPAGRRAAPSEPAVQGPAAGSPAAPPVEIAGEARRRPEAPKTALGAMAADSAPAPGAGDAALAQLEAASDDELALAMAVQDAGDVESADDLALVEQLDTVESLEELDRGGHG